MSNPTTVILGAQNTLNTLEANQKKHQREQWWRNNWYWVAGGALVLIGGSIALAMKKNKK